MLLAAVPSLQPRSDLSCLLSAFPPLWSVCLRLHHFPKTALAWTPMMFSAANPGHTLQFQFYLLDPFSFSTVEAVLVFFSLPPSPSLSFCFLCFLRWNLTWF